MQVLGENGAVHQSGDDQVDVINKRWLGADKLETGDLLTLQDENQVIVEDLKLQALETPIKVYNFEVEDLHTYYVGDDSILFHNQGCNLNTIKDSYLKKKLKLDAHAIKREYLGAKAKVSLYDLAVDKNTGTIYIIDKIGKIVEKRVNHKNCGIFPS